MTYKSGYDHDVCLVVPDQLDNEDVLAWVECVESNIGAHDVIMTVDGDDDEGNEPLEDDVVVHEIIAEFDSEEEEWIYAIPLARDITEEEGRAITDDWAEYYMSSAGDDDEDGGDWYGNGDAGETGEFEIISTTEPACPGEFCNFDEVDVDGAYEGEYVKTTDEYKHNRWIEEMTGKGWRFGVSASREEKFSPLMKPWHELTSHQKERMRAHFVTYDKNATKFEL